MLERRRLCRGTLPLLRCGRKIDRPGGDHTRAHTMEPTSISHGSRVCMTEYPIATRAVIILWTNPAVMRAEVVFDAIEADWSAVASSYKGLCLRLFVARAVWNGIAIRRK